MLFSKVQALMEERGYSLHGFSSPERAISDWVNGKKEIYATVWCGKELVKLSFLWQIILVSTGEFALAHPRFEVFEQKLNLA